MTAYQLAEISGYSALLIKERIRRGWSVEDAVEKERNSKGVKRSQAKAKCGAVSLKDCFSCHYKDCIIIGRLKFEDEPDLHIKKGKDSINDQTI